MPNFMQISQWIKGVSGYIIVPGQAVRNPQAGSAACQGKLQGLSNTSPNHWLGCNSFGNAAATARATDSELCGYLTTWEGTRILARVTSCHRYHYSDVIMSARAYHITSLTIVYSTVYSGADQRKHQSSASLIFVRGIHRWPVNSAHKGPVTQKMFPFDDVIMMHH